MYIDKFDMFEQCITMHEFGRWNTGWDKAFVRVDRVVSIKLQENIKI